MLRTSLRLAIFLTIYSIAAAAHGFEVRAHALKIPADGIGQVEIRNRFDTPVIVRVTVTDEIDVFPRRFRLLPGQRQTVKAKGTVKADSAIRFSYATETEKRGAHARLTLRLPVEEASHGS